MSSVETTGCPTLVSPFLERQGGVSSRNKPYCQCRINSPPCRSKKRNDEDGAPLVEKALRLFPVGLAVRIVLHNLCLRIFQKNSSARSKPCGAKRPSMKKTVRKRCARFAWRCLRPTLTSKSSSS